MVVLEAPLAGGLVMKTLVLDAAADVEVDLDVEEVVCGGRRLGDAVYVPTCMTRQSRSKHIMQPAGSAYKHSGGTGGTPGRGLGDKKVGFGRHGKRVSRTGDR